MTEKKFFIVFILLSALAVSSCSSLGRQESTADSADNKDGLLPPDWKYEIEITHEGSRSEGSVGRLFYMEDEITNLFDTVRINSIVFRYTAMQNIWDSWGYIREEEKQKPSETEKTISTDSICRGWYEDDYKHKRKDTPDEWIHIEAGELRLWVDPSRLNEAVDYYKPKPQHNQHGLMPIRKTEE